MDFTLKLNENYDTSTYRHTNFQTANLASLITIGPNSPLLDIEPLNDFDFDISSRIFIGIRYRFGKKKSEVEVIEKGWFTGGAGGTDLEHLFEIPIKIK